MDIIEEAEDLDLVMGPSFFDQLVQTIEIKCPLISDFAKGFVATREDRVGGKKATTYKYKCALQLIQGLATIKSQKSKNDFSTMFGLLLISHGA